MCHSGILPQAEAPMVEVDLETPAPTPDNSPAPTTPDTKEERTTISKLWVSGCGRIKKTTSFVIENIYPWTCCIFSCTPQMAKCQDVSQAPTHDVEVSERAGRLFPQPGSCLLMIYLWPSEFMLMLRMFVRALNEEQRRACVCQAGKLRRSQSLPSAAMTQCCWLIFLGTSTSIFHVHFIVFRRKFLEITLETFSVRRFSFRRK